MKENPGPKPMPRDTHGDGPFLLHPAGGVVQVSELHGHLLVYGDQELLPLLQLGLQLLPVRSAQLGGACNHTRLRGAAPGSPEAAKAKGQTPAPSGAQQICVVQPGFCTQARALRVFSPRKLCSI